MLGDSHPRLGPADRVRAPVVVVAAAPDERHGTGFQPPAVVGAHVGVAVVPDAHVVLRMLDEAQRLGARRGVAVDEVDQRGARHEEALRRGVDQHGKALQRIGFTERAVGAVGSEHRDQALDVALGDGHRVLGEELLDLDEIVSSLLT